MSRAGHAGAFYAWPVPPERLAEFINMARTLPIHGLAVTIPHKTAVLPLLDGLTAEAQAVGAANTLFWRDNELWGHNTDVAGFLAGLDSFRNRPGKLASALVLGAGGAACAVLYALRNLGVPQIRLAARSGPSGAALAARFNAEFIPWEKRVSGPAQLVVNTTPLGMAGAAGAEDTPLAAAEFTALAGDWPPAACLAYDLVYNPSQTPFLRAAATTGWGVQGGLTMLAAQGLAQFELWSGRAQPPLNEALDLLAGALAQG